MSIASSPTRDKFPLSRKKILKKTLGYAVPWFFMLLIGWIISSPLVNMMNQDAGNNGAIINLNMTGLGIIFLTLYIIIVLLGYLYQVWYFNTYYYDLSDDFITIRKHPITPKEIVIPYERIQDVYMDQDIFDRMIGLYDVHLSSATYSSGMEAHIDGIEREAADGLRQLILTTVQQKLAKDTNGQSK